MTSRNVRIAVALCLAALISPASGQEQSPPVDQAEPAIGSVASVFQPAVLTRKASKPALVKKGGDIWKGDQLRTGAGGSLGITFDDDTTFSLSSDAVITIDDFVYGEGKSNTAIFNVTRGTVSFIAAQIAKNGDMRIATPTAILGIRGTTGIIEVTAAGPTNVKLYEGAGGTVGRIEMFGRDGARVGELTRAASGFSLQLVGQRLAAAPLAISPAQVQRDRGLVQRIVSQQNIGRQLNEQRRNIRGPDRRGQGPDQRGRRDGQINRDRRNERAGDRGRRDNQPDRQRREQRRDDRDRRSDGPADRRSREQDRRDQGPGPRARRDPRGDGVPRTQRPTAPRASPPVQGQPQPGQQRMQQQQQRQPTQQQQRQPAQQQQRKRPQPKQPDDTRKPPPR